MKKLLILFMASLLFAGCSHGGKRMIGGGFAAEEAWIIGWFTPTTSITRYHQCSEVEEVDMDGEPFMKTVEPCTPITDWMFLSTNPLLPGLVSSAVNGAAAGAFIGNGLKRSGSPVTVDNSNQVTGGGGCRGNCGGNPGRGRH